MDYIKAMRIINWDFHEFYDFFLDRVDDDFFREHKSKQDNYAKCALESL